MIKNDESLLLAPNERPAAQIVQAQGRARMVLVCEHASSFIPAALNGLGLESQARRSHAAWDIGALDLAQNLAQQLDAPLVSSCVSRLVYDCNRPPDAIDAIPAKSEIFDIPGNRNLDDTARNTRINAVYKPFQTLLRQVLDGRTDNPLLVTIHSFTETYAGKSRETEIGILHDADTSLAVALLDRLQARSSFLIEMNEPYSASDGVTHTLQVMAGPRGLPNVMIEVRNDLIDHPGGVQKIADLLAAALGDILAQHAGPGAVKPGQAGQ